VATREALPRPVLRRRLLLGLFALGRPPRHSRRRLRRGTRQHLRVRPPRHPRRPANPTHHPPRPIEPVEANVIRPDIGYERGHSPCGARASGNDRFRTSMSNVPFPVEQKGVRADRLPAAAKPGCRGRRVVVGTYRSRTRHWAWDRPSGGSDHALRKPRSRGCVEQWAMTTVVRE
jgi:hypothetical protein